MSVHCFPSAHPEEARSAVSKDPAAPPDERANPLLNLSQVARRLGVQRFGDQRLLGYLTALIAGHGFPRPLPAPVKKRAVAAVHRESQWRGDAVEAWFDTFLPPACATALDAKALEAAASAMDHAAANLRVVS